ncbi:histidinol-phosphate transaminase [Alteromonas sp. a30]|uniref:histidinol-phosphate transaminase n=1 Tax=Alteromonas sp. a30 TaxID=2730917 RepID=UPI00228069C9|nr:histidinol-phosphate transaminase [Alteromonas sp. a30]MCY7296753.1 histidinol-phosphate transaminase [Alteromonas sp. a30]
MGIASKLCLPRVLEIESPYRSPKEESKDKREIWLDTNELQNSFNGLTIDSSEYNLYPEFQDFRLRQAYADFCNNHINADQVAIVRGADEAIEMVIRAFCVPGEDAVVDMPPTYAMYRLTAEMYGVDVVTVPRLSSYAIDLQKLAKLTPAKVIFLCSPNNPTGNRTSREELISLLEHTKDTSLVVVDEAYIEFCPESTCVDLIEQYPNLVVIRTLSKAFGLAAVRCGFILASEEVIDIIYRVMAPYPVPEPVTQVSRQSLSEEGLERMQSNVKGIELAKRNFIEAIKDLACVRSIISGYSNFLLVEFQDESVDLSVLEDNLIYIREVALGHGITPMHRRISIGTDEQMQKIAQCLSAVDARFVAQKAAEPKQQEKQKNKAAHLATA